MKIEEIIAIASKAYPDDLVKDAFEEPLDGDGLANFIASELQSVYQPGAGDVEQLEAATDAMARATKEVGRVFKALGVAYAIAFAKEKENS